MGFEVQGSADRTNDNTTGARTAVLTGFDVIDAVGIRMGSVSDWYFDPHGRVTLLRVSMSHSTFDAASFLIPVFYVTILDTSRRKIQVRALRRLTVPQLCEPYDAVSTTPDKILALAAAHPPANEAVAAALAELS